MYRLRQGLIGIGLRTAFICAASAAVLLSATLGSASAKTRIEGRVDAVHLVAEDAPISEILAALSAQFDLTFSPCAELDRAVTGVYSGSLPQVLGRILDGYDYITEISVDGIALNVLGRSGSIARPSSNRPPSPVTAASHISPAPPMSTPSGYQPPPSQSVHSRTAGH